MSEALHGHAGSRSPQVEPASHRAAGVWRIEMLGWLRATSGELTHSRFSTRQTASLLAYLALHLRRDHPREELVEILWPGSDPAASKNRLSQALASLRRQFEPPGLAKGSVLVGDYRSVRLNPEAVVTDVGEYERCAKAIDSETPKALAKLREALSLYRGELLPGFYDEWIGPERQRLNDLYAAVLARAADVAEEEGDLNFACEGLVKLVALDPLNEENQQNLMMLYCRRGQPAQALQQYDSLASVLKSELGSPPSALSQSLADKIRRGDFQKLATRATQSRRKKTLPEEEAQTHRVQLPPQSTRFFGRAEEIAQARVMLGADGCRLVNLMGAPGSGKSRLSIEIAKKLGERYHAVWFVPLADLSDSEEIPDAIRRAISPGAPEGGSVMDEVLRRLRATGHSLLVLDNFERFSERGGKIVRRLLDEVPDLDLLVTSRHRLGLYEERDILVAPLPIPEVDSELEKVAEVSSVQLFVNRAQAVRPDFQLTARNMSAVSALCRRLEGVPLAIELAAAWCSTLSPTQLLAGMEQRFELLVSRRRDIAPRHRSLRAAIEYGYELLPAELQDLFKRLAVFRGGWSLDSAQAVATVVDARQALDELAERSLLRREASVVDEETRFDMLDALRDHALEQLTGQEERDAKNLHAEYFLKMAEHAASESDGAKQALGIARLTAEHGNLISALQWCYDNDRIEWGLRMACALEFYWDARGPLAEGREWLERLLAADQAGIPETLEANAHRVLGWVAWSQGDFSGAENQYQNSLSIYRRLGRKADVSLVLNQLSAVGIWLWDSEKATQTLNESLELSEEVGDRLGIARALRGLGLAARQQNQFEAAKEYYSRALALYEELDNKGQKAALLGNLSITAAHEGQFSLAEKYARKAIAVGEEVGSRRIVASNLENLAAALFGKGSKSEALELMIRSIHIVQEIGNRPMLFYKLETASYMTHDLGYEEQSAMFAAAVERISRETGVRPDNPSRFQSAKAERVANMSEADYKAASDWGESLSDSEAVELFVEWARPKIGEL